jgi:hypothetical protein
MALIIQDLEKLFGSFEDVLDTGFTIERILAKALARQRQGHQSSPDKFRASAVGKPWIIQMLDKWSVDRGGRKMFSISSMMKMVDGIVTQLWVEQMIELFPMTFDAEVELIYQDVIGHADIVIKRDNEVVLLECKSMASYLISTFKKAPNDNYGYLSQLSFYTSCLKIKYPHHRVTGAFVLYDRSSAKFTLVQIADFAISKKFERIATVVPELLKIGRLDFDTLLEKVTIPPPMNGVIPPPMQGSRWCTSLYANNGKHAHLRTNEEIVQSLRVRSEFTEF